MSHSHIKAAGAERSRFPRVKLQKNTGSYIYFNAFLRCLSKHGRTKVTAPPHQPPPVHQWEQLTMQNVVMLLETSNQCHVFFQKLMRIT